MYSPLQLVRKYLNYYLTASNGKGHRIHSPFVFDFIIHVLNDKHAYAEYASIERLRRQLLQDKTMLEIEDLGAGSVTEGRGDGGKAMGLGEQGARETRWPIRRRSVAEIARHAAKPKKLGQLLFRIARYYRPGNILELGTSLGLSTAYLAAGRKEARVMSVEGAPAVSAVAAKNLQSLGFHHVDLITGNFDEVLRSSLSGRPNEQGKHSDPEVFDLAFVDGNHREEPTLHYFNWLADRAAPSSMLIFDDIHWSREMENAWTKIQNDPRVLLTIDLFFLGLVVFRDEFKVKQHFVIRY